MYFALHHFLIFCGRPANNSQALIDAASNVEQYGNLSNSIYSVFFFGVPHQGLDTAALKEMVAKEPTKELIAELQEGSTTLRSLSEGFRRTAKRLKIVTCWELEETPTMQQTSGQWKRTGPTAWMVKMWSASLYLPNEERIAIRANHSMMAKLSDEPGSEYHIIKDHLISHVKLAPEAVVGRLGPFRRILRDFLMKAILWLRNLQLLIYRGRL